MYISPSQPAPSLGGGPLMADDSEFQITCRICNKPLKLGIDTAADEDGKAVHETCYTKLVLKGNSPEAPIAE